MEIDTIVRAIATKDQFFSSSVATGTYIFPSEEGGKMGHSSLLGAGLPIVSVVPVERFDQHGMNGGFVGDREEKVSLEWIDLEGGGSWRVECGLRSLGIGSDESGPRYRIDFRDRYGPAQLRKQLFGAGSARRIDRLELRAVSWPSNTSPDNLSHNLKAVYWGRLCQDLMGAAGQPHLRGRFCRLDLTGEERGHFELSELPDWGFAREYFGGERSELDILVGRSGPRENDEDAWYKVEEGNETGWGKLLEQVARPRRSEGDGLDYLEKENFAVFVILSWFRSGPGALTGESWTAIRNRSHEDGFRFLLGPMPIAPSEEDIEWVNPRDTGGLARLWSSSISGSEFRLQLQDVIQDLFFDEGILCERQLAERGRQFLNGIPSVPGSGEDVRLESLLESAERRRSDLLQFLHSMDLVSKIGGIVWGVEKGGASSGIKVELESDRGEIALTLDGTDPRLTGGQLRNSAVYYDGAITVRSPTVISCRVKQGSDWGPLCRRSFDVR